MVDIEEKTSDPVAKELMEIAKEKGLDTLWDRLDKQSPQCGFGDTGLCCRICLQGPCRINPHGGEPNKGVCGARDYTMWPEISFEWPQRAARHIRITVGTLHMLYTPWERGMHPLTE